MVGYRGEFERSLESIDARVIELFTMVVEDLPTATEALLGDGGEPGVVLADRERQVDALYVEAEELAGRQILIQAPAASDLRFLLTVLRVAPQLERSHDLVADIASRAVAVRAAGLPAGCRELAGRMGGLAAGMWRDAADAWYARDQGAAAALGERGAEMGGLRAALTGEVAGCGLPVLAAMEMAQVARDYDRLGAHAVNVTRRVAYLAGRQR